MKPLLGGERVYLVQMMVLFLFFVVAFFSSATLAIEFRLRVDKIRNKKIFLTFYALCIFTAADLVTDLCYLPWRYHGIAFSTFMAMICSAVIGIFLFDRTPVYMGKEAKKSKRPDKLTILVVCVPVLITLVVATGFCRAGYGGVKSIIIWFLCSLAVFCAIGIHGAIKSFDGKADDDKSNILEESEKLKIYLWLFHRLAGIRWPA